MTYIVLATELVQHARGISDLSRARNNSGNRLKALGKKCKLVTHVITLCLEPNALRLFFDG